MNLLSGAEIQCPYYPGIGFVLFFFFKKIYKNLSGHWKLSVTERCPYHETFDCIWFQVKDQYLHWRIVQELRFQAWINLSIDCRYLPDIKVTKCRNQTLRQSFNGKLRRTVSLRKRNSDYSKMTAVIDNEPTLSGFHAGQNGLNKSHVTKIVYFEQLLCHVNRDKFERNSHHRNTGIIDCGLKVFQ